MNTANRVLWAVIGLILLTAGVAGVLANQDRLDGVDANSAILPQSLNDRWSDWGVWAPIVSVAAGVVLAILALVLLRAETRRRGGRTLPELVLPAHPAEPGPSTVTPPTGRTRVDGRTLIHALTADLVRDRSIDDASANLTGTATDPRLLLRLTVQPGTDLGVLRGVVDTALERFHTTSGLRPHLTDVDIRLANERISRVH